MEAAAVSAEANRRRSQSGRSRVDEFNGVVDQDSPTIYEFRRSLREVSTAARSLRLLRTSNPANPRALYSASRKPMKADENFDAAAWVALSLLGCGNFSA